MLTFLKKAALSIDGSQGIPLRAGDGINKVSLNDFARFTSMARRGYPARGKDVPLTRQADGAQTIAACKNLDPDVLEGDGRRTETRILTLTHVERAAKQDGAFLSGKATSQKLSLASDPRMALESAQAPNQLFWVDRLGPKLKLVTMLPRLVHDIAGTGLA